jgi:hypothetical protein
MKGYRISLDSLLDEIAHEVKATGEPRAATIQGWNHDLILDRLEARGARFVDGRPSFDTEVAYARNGEGRWVVETWRTEPNPRSVVIHAPDGFRQ